MTRPLCNAGACASILAGIAEWKICQTKRISEQLAAALRVAFDEIGLTVEQRERMPQVLRAAVERFTEGARE